LSYPAGQTLTPQQGPITHFEHRHRPYGMLLLAGELGRALPGRRPIPDTIADYLLDPMFRIFLVLLTILTAGIGLAQAEPVFPPGLRVGLEPAGALAIKPGMSGFQDSERDVTVTIAELPPETYGELTNAVFGKAPAGATDITRELFAFQDGLGYLHHARVVENGVPSQRWLLLTMTVGTPPAFAGVVNVKVPEAASATYSEAVVRKMLASIVIRKPPVDEQLELIPFKLENLANFHVARVTPDSVLVVEDPDKDTSQQPYMVVSIGRAQPSQMEDRGLFSRDLLTHAPLRELTLQSGEQMRINGAPGFEIRGRAQDIHNNNVSVVQWVRFLGGGFIRIIGVAPREQWDEMFNRFRAVRDGVTMRQ
jgi:hypothetical protein